MKLTERFEEILSDAFQESIVIDKKGDGHHVEIICIDEIFAGKSRLEKSRYAFKALSGFIKQVHAVTVKCFTPEEWKEKKDSFESTKYIHIKR